MDTNDLECTAVHCLPDICLEGGCQGVGWQAPDGDVIRGAIPPLTSDDLWFAPAYRHDDLIATAHLCVCAPHAC